MYTKEQLENANDFLLDSIVELEEQVELYEEMFNNIEKLLENKSFDEMTETEKLIWGEL